MSHHRTVFRSPTDHPLSLFSLFVRCLRKKRKTLFSITLSKRPASRNSRENVWSWHRPVLDDERSSVHSFVLSDSLEFHRSQIIQGLEPEIVPSNFEENLPLSSFQDIHEYPVSTATYKAVDVYERLVVNQNGFVYKIFNRVPDRTDSATILITPLTWSSEVRDVFITTLMADTIPTSLLFAQPIPSSLHMHSL